MERNSFRSTEKPSSEGVTLDSRISSQISRFLRYYLEDEKRKGFSEIREKLEKRIKEEQERKNRELTPDEIQQLLAEILYENYVTTPKSAEKGGYDEKDPEIREWIRGYLPGIVSLAGKLLKLDLEGFGLKETFNLSWSFLTYFIRRLIEILPDKEIQIRGKNNLTLVLKKYWFYCILGEFEKKEVLGAIYLNIKPQYMFEVFKDIVSKLKERGLNAELRIPMKGSIKVANSPDKMVLFFDPKDLEQIKEVILEIYNSHRDKFEDWTMPFAKKIERDIEGIGFAHYREDKSFGLLVAEILAYLYEVYKRHKGESGIFQQMLKAYVNFCETNNIDPNNPALY